MFKRLITLIKGFFGLFLSKVENSNPRAILEAEKENIRKHLEKYRDSLAKHEGKVIKARQDLEKCEKQVEDLTEKVQTFITMNNDEQAARVAGQLEETEKKIETLKEFIDMAEDVYENLRADRDHAVRAAREKIDKISSSIDEAELHESMADLKEQTAGLGDDLSSSGLSRLEANLDNRVANAKGRAKVAKDDHEDMDPTASKEYRQAANSNALARFKAKNGLNDSEAEPTPPTIKDSSSTSMGPSSSGLEATGSDE